MSKGPARGLLVTFFFFHSTSACIDSAPPFFNNQQSTPKSSHLVSSRAPVKWGAFHKRMMRHGGVLVVAVPTRHHLASTPFQVTAMFVSTLNRLSSCYRSLLPTSSPKHFRPFHFICSPDTTWTKAEAYLLVCISRCRSMYSRFFFYFSLSLSFFLRMNLLRRKSILCNNGCSSHFVTQF